MLVIMIICHVKYVICGSEFVRGNMQLHEAKLQQYCKEILLCLIKFN